MIRAMEGVHASPHSGEGPNGGIPRPTPQLHAFFLEQKKAMAEADFSAMVSEITSLYHKYRDSLEAEPRGAARARVLHRMMDAAVATASAVKVSCHKGCYGCCHSEVEITSDEVEVLLETIAAGTVVDRSRLELQAARERKSPEWAKFWSTENRCVFLDSTGACGIYEHRPAACRRLLVTTPPEACTTLGAPLHPVRILLAEVLLSAALSLEAGGLASISKRLVPRLPA